MSPRRTGNAIRYEIFSIHWGMVNAYLGVYRRIFSFEPEHASILRSFRNEVLGSIAARPQLFKTGTGNVQAGCSSAGAETIFRIIANLYLVLAARRLTRPKRIIHAHAPYGSGTIDGLPPQTYQNFESEAKRAASANLSMLADVVAIKQSRNATYERLKEEHRKLDAALENMAHSLAMFNADGTLAVCNNRFKRLLGIEKAKDINTFSQTIAALKTKIMDDDLPLEVVPQLMVLGECVEFTLRMKDGRVKSAAFQPVVRRALETSGLPAQRLELEITESLLLKDTERTIEVLHSLKSLGVRISMDDFGTGYSSLSYLRRFPFDKLKIDRSFVEDIARNSEAYAIIKAIIQLGSSLGMTITAEGVETLEQRNILQSLNSIHYRLAAF
eukprot:gene17316-17507_t